MAEYEYKKTEPWNAPYVREVITREIAPPLFIRSRADRIIVHFDRELTPEQKARLDSIMSSPRVPRAEYEFGMVGLEEEIEREIGVRPVRATWDELRGRGTLQFDRELTPEQEAGLKRVLDRLRRGAALRRI